MLWCWVSGPLGLRRGMAILKPGENPPDTLGGYAASRRNPTDNAPENSWRLGITSGTAAFFSGAHERLLMPCANTCQRQLHCWSRLRGRTARENSVARCGDSIPDARTSAL